MSGQDRWLETPCPVLPKWNKRLALICQVVRKLDYLGHTSEMLAQPDPATVPDFR
jgi:hypothetical protein